MKINNNKSNGLPQFQGRYPVQMNFNDFNSKEVLWCGEQIHWSKFKEIREYIDACLDRDSRKWQLENLVEDLDVITDLILALDNQIPWFSKSDEEKAVKGDEASRRLVANRIERLRTKFKGKKRFLRRRVERIQKLKNEGGIRIDGWLPWVVLPNSSSGWEQALDNHLEGLKNSRFNCKQCDPSRLKEVGSLGHDRVYEGRAQFDGYYVFVFQDLNKTILECPIVGNAVFIFSGDWKAFTKLSKSDLRRESKVQRFIHRENGDWIDRLKKALQE